MTRKTGREIAFILVPVLYGLIAILVAMLVCWSGQYPMGSDTMTHIYRGNFMFEALKGKNIFPIYDAGWYNGVEIIKYCPLLPMYILAACQAIAGGNPLDGYLVFVGILFFAGALVWFLIGVKRNRVLMGTVMGLVWFFMPNNLYMLFMEGNLSRCICLVIIPLLVSLILDYISNDNQKGLFKILFTYVFLFLCDTDYAIMFAIAMLIFGVVYAILNHKWNKILLVWLTMLIAFMVSGIFSVTYLIATKDASNVEVMGKYFQSILKTINPLERYKTLNEYYYFGLSILLLSMLGIIGNKRNNISGFIFAILILVLTASSFEPVMKILPGRDYLLMGQYISIALAFVLCSFINWDSLKKYIQLIVCVVLILDIIPSMNLVYGVRSGIPVEERFEEQYETTMIKKAKEITKQRLAFLDGGELEAMGSYLASNYEFDTKLAFGSDYRSAATDENITQLNKALNGGFYNYLFDRCKELGNDTVLIKLSQINAVDAPVTMLDASANACGYQLAGENEFYRLYHMEVEGNWGTIAKYEGIGIGSGASDISLVYPNVKEVTSNNLEDFTYEELVQYKVIYLSGFTYNERSTAEELIIKLSNAGVRIVILADGIPEDRNSKKQDFLDLSCNDIVFSNGYPLLDTKLGILDCDYFPQGFEEWNTVYVNGLDKVWGTVKENELDLAFYGTVKNDNIIVVGLNLTYYYSLIRDEGIGKLLSDITGMGESNIPDRNVVPLNVEYSYDGINIKSEYDDVNTSLAGHKIFKTSSDIYIENNLLYVNKGDTAIKMNYSSFYIGAVISLIGIACGIILFVNLHKKNKTLINQDEQQTQGSDEDEDKSGEGDVSETDKSLQSAGDDAGKEEDEASRGNETE